MCLACGTVNGVDMKICVTCEKPLESHDLKQEKEEYNDNKNPMTGNTVCVFD